MSEATVIQRNTLQAAIHAARAAGYTGAPHHASRVKLGKQISWTLFFTVKGSV